MTQKEEKVIGGIKKVIGEIGLGEQVRGLDVLR